jgi:hypothetical protein
VTHARAGYWLAYKLTFLSQERLIVAPVDGVDRYPPYAAAVESQGRVPTLHIPAQIGTADCASLVTR